MLRCYLFTCLPVKPVQELESSTSCMCGTVLVWYARWGKAGVVMGPAKKGDERSWPSSSSCTVIIITRAILALLFIMYSHNH